MIKEVLDTFNKIYNEFGEELLFNSITLKGIYFLIDKNFNYKIFKFDKESEKDKMYNFFASREYYSTLIEMNKPVDPNKQIHSCNYLSFFIKKNALDSKKEKIIESINAYYEILKYPNIRYKYKKLDMYQAIVEEIGDPNIDKIDEIKKYIEKNLFSLYECANLEDDNDYIKIFFDADIREYEKENRRYIIPNIFSKVEFNENIEGIIKGVPGNNINYNPKKPYLENKTRKSKRAFYLSIEESLIQKKLYDYLYNLAGQGFRNIYISKDFIIPLKFALLDIPFCGYFLRISKGKKEAEIENFDIVSNLNNSTNFILKNYVGRIFEEELFEYEVVLPSKTIFEMINYITKYKIFNILFNDETFYEGISSQNVKALKEKVYNIFFTGVEKKEALINILSKMLLNIISESYSKTIYTLNLIKSLRGEAMVNLEKMENVIFKAEDIQNDKEYAFIIGQFLYFLESLKNTNFSNKTNEELAVILKLKTNISLRKKILDLFTKYSFKIKPNNQRIKNIYSAILKYKKEDPALSFVFLEDLILGYLSENIIYKKTNVKVEESNDEE